MNKKAANIQTLTRLDELEARIQAQFENVAALNLGDVRDTIHDIADQVVEIAQALPAILERIEQIAKWVAEATGNKKPVGAVTEGNVRPVGATPCSCA